VTDRWDRVGALFDAALATPPAERHGFVAAAAESDEVKAEVISLLASHETVGEFLETPAAPPPAALGEGTQIGAYRIRRVLGAGGMGVVYEADDTRLHRRVALKAVAPHLAEEPRQRERLKQEARAAAALAHPGIATIYALEEAGGQFYIVSEYLDGETLRADIERGSLTESAAVATALDVARALCVAHERGIVHRDLKPENIVRTTAGALKILDFGLAQFEEGANDLASLSRLTQPGFLAGTPPYMSPEQLLGRHTDFRTDLFSFGVLLYELATGRHPFSGESLPSTIARILAAPPQPVPPTRDISEDLAAIINRCLQKDPAARYASTSELVRALEDLPAAPHPSLPVAPLAPLAPVAASHPSLPVAPLAPLAPVVPAPHPSLPVAPVAPVAPVPAAVWWWRFHQLTAAVAYWAMVWPAWHVHGSLGRAGLFFFFALLAAIVVAGNLRLHLWFSSRVYPEDLAEQRRDVGVWIRSADVGVAALLIIGGIALPEDRVGWAALFISFGIGSALAALVIEPATARAAFRGHSRNDAQTS
jgi:serine/threonine protein kinase